jgi:hypothetical protein
MRNQRRDAGVSRIYLLRFMSVGALKEPGEMDSPGD